MPKSKFVFATSLALLLSTSLAVCDAGAKKNIQAEGGVKQDQYNGGVSDDDQGTMIGMVLRFRPLSPNLGADSAWEITIIKISLTGPAVDSGLKVGDNIVAVDGKSTRYRHPDEVMRLFRGAKDSRYKLSIRRGPERFDVEFGRVANETLPALPTDVAPTKAVKQTLTDYTEQRLQSASQLVATAGSGRLAAQDSPVSQPNRIKALEESEKGRFALESRDVTEAEKSMRRAADLDPSFTEARYLHALLLDKQEKYADAEKILVRLVEEKPQFVEAWEALATAQQAQKKLDEAMKSYKKCAMLTTNSGMDTEFRARIQELQDRLVVPNAKPTENDPLVSLIVEAQSAVDTRNFKLAADKFKAAWELDQTNANVLRQLAQCHARIGNYSEAVVAYEQYVKLVPDSPDMSQLKLNVVNLKNAMKTSPAKASPDGEDYLTDMLEDFARWKRSTLKVYINDGKLVPGHQPVFDEKIKESFASWAEASLGRLSFQYVTKPDYADILCLWSDDPSVVGSPLKGGVTRVEPWGNEIMKATMHLLTIERGDKTKHIDAESARRLVLHEIGHALGLSGHSLNPKDIMFAFEGDQTQLSDRDKKTLIGLYAMKPPKPKPGSIPKTVVRMSH